jgi:glycosyltransferase involved in cell wall biosynthesis
VVKHSLSVIIPCFNAAATLAEAIESSLAQVDVRPEVVVVDDGSTDQSLAVARGFEPAVRVISGRNRGVSIARNRGIAAATGDWLLFLDADDLLVAGTVRRRLETAEATGADIVVCDWQEFLNCDGKTEDGPVKSADMTALAADAEVACATHWKPAIDALMYRRAVVEKIGGFREDLPLIEDPRFLFDAAREGARFARSAHLGARVRISGQSLSRRDPALFWRCCLLNGSQIEALWRAPGPLSASRRAALSDIYNCSAHGLFRADDPAFREALAALRASGLPVSGRNRLAELLSDILGHHHALQIATCWTTSRRIVADFFDARRGGST